jgi:prepilin-type N-terminal cleavage/methylation domain-containing protein
MIVNRFKKMSNGGFTIVELLVTIAIIGIASIGIASLFYSIQVTQQQSRYVDAATRAAQREIEVLRNNSYNNLQDGQVINFTSDLPDSLPANKSGIVNVSEPSNGLKRVDVTVSYSNSGRTHSVKLSSLIGIIGLSQ